MSTSEWLIIVLTGMFAVVFLGTIVYGQGVIQKRKVTGLVAWATAIHVVTMVILAVTMNRLVGPMERKMRPIDRPQTEIQRIAVAWLEAAEAEQVLLSDLSSLETEARKWLESDNPVLKQHGEELLSDVEKRRRSITEDARRSIPSSTEKPDR